MADIEWIKNRLDEYAKDQEEKAARWEMRLKRTRATVAVHLSEIIALQDDDKGNGLKLAIRIAQDALHGLTPSEDEY